MQYSNTGTIRILTYLMFLLFAMTTDAVGVIIPEVIETFSLNLTQASTFHYGTMIAIALSGVGLGFLADRFGRKIIIVAGLILFAAACFLFPAGNSFGFFLLLLLLSGTAIGLFKTAALALIGDISESSHEHTRTMNFAEGFFGIGAIIGPAIVTWLIAREVSWVYLYPIAGACALVLVVIASFTQYPATSNIKREHIDLKTTLAILRDPYAVGFSTAIALYVVVEAGIYVWMPTLLKGYEGSYTLLAAYALSIFFIFRAAGRFLGAMVLHFIKWEIALSLFSFLIFCCFLGSVVIGINAAVWLLPASGLFMSIIYPTLNSKGISCFHSEKHGAIAGVILFFTAAAAALGPLVMGIVGDLFGDVSYGFYFACMCSALLLVMSIWNQLKGPAASRLKQYSFVSGDTTTG